MWCQSLTRTHVVPSFPRSGGIECSNFLFVAQVALGSSEAWLCGTLSHSHTVQSCIALHLLLGALGVLDVLGGTGVARVEVGGVTSSIII